MFKSLSLYTSIFTLSMSSMRIGSIGQACQQGEENLEHVLSLGHAH